MAGIFSLRVRCVSTSLARIGSRISGDAESALVRRGYLRRSGGALPHASRGVPPNGSDHGEPRQRGLAGTCCGVDEVGEGARGRGKAALISAPGSGRGPNIRGQPHNGRLREAPVATATVLVKIILART